MATSVESQVRKTLEARKKAGKTVIGSPLSSSSSSSKKKSSGGSSKPPLQMGIIEASTGKVIQEAGTKKSSGGSSKSSSSSVSTKGFTTTSTMLDTKTGIATVTKRDSKGNVISGFNRAMTLQERLQAKPQLTEAQKLQRAGFELKPMQFGQSGQFGSMTPQQIQIFQEKQRQEQIRIGKDQRQKLANRSKEAAKYFGNAVVSFGKGGAKVVSKPITETIRFKETVDKFYDSYKKAPKDIRDKALKEALKETFTKPQLVEVAKKTAEGYFDKDTKNFLTTVVTLYGGAKVFEKAGNFISKKFSPTVARRLGLGVGGAFAGTSVAEAIRNPSPQNDVLALANLGFAGGGALLISATAKAYKGLRFIGKTKDNKYFYLDKDAVNKGTFPTSPDSKKVLDMLKKAGNKVVTISPGGFKKKVAGESKKSELGLEDSGIYVSPKGKGNPYFARIQQKEDGGYTVSPTKIWDSVKQEFQIPRVTEFQTKGAITIPKNVVNKKGFKEVSDFGEKKVSGTGKVILTKRSQLGRGEVKSKGESGTTEIEFVIPRGSKFQIKSKGKFIEVNGQKFLIDEGILAINKKYKTPKTRAEKILNYIRNKRNNVKKISSSSSKVSNKKFRSSFKGVSGVSSKRDLTKSNTKGGISNKGKGTSGGGTSGKDTSGGGTSGKGTSGGGTSGKGTSGGGTSGKGTSGGGTSSKGKSQTTTKKGTIKPNTKIKSKVKTNPMGAITYKTSKGTLKTIKTGLPYNKAKQLAFRTIDNTTLASVTIKKYGQTKAKDIAPVSNSKFRVKKSKNPKVQKLVEKRSKRIDTKGEKKGLQASKYLAKQLKKAKAKKKSKK